MTTHVVCSLNLTDVQTADASSSVRSYKAPSSPKAPALPTDLASELSKFDAEEPSFAAPASTKTASTTEGAESADEYLTFLEKDLPKADAHH
jgi:F-type H+-transporting ATPase subunit h